MQSRQWRSISKKIYEACGRAVKQTVILRHESAIAQCVQGAARQLLGDHFLGSCQIACIKSIFIRTWLETQVLYTRPVNSATNILL